MNGWYPQPLLTKGSCFLPYFIGFDHWVLSECEYALSPFMNRFLSLSSQPAGVIISWLESLMDSIPIGGVKRKEKEKKENKGTTFLRAYSMHLHIIN